MATYDKPLQQSLSIVQAAANAVATLNLAVPFNATRMRVRSLSVIKTGTAAVFAGDVEVGVAADTDKFYTVPVSLDPAATVVDQTNADLPAVDVGEEAYIVVTVPDGGAAGDATRTDLMIEWF